MAYKTICVIVSDPASDGAALAAAAAAALRHDAHLDVKCISIEPVQFEAMTMGAAMPMLEYDLTEARNRAQLLMTWSQGRLPIGLGKVAMQAVVVPQIGLDRMIARLTSYADLVFAAKPYGPGHTPLQVATLEAVLFGTGAPVIVVPDTGAGGGADARSDSRSDMDADAGAAAGKPYGRIVVAWNETEAALAAIRGALPMLKAAAHVDIVMVDPPSHSPERSDPGGAITLMLSRHGVKAEVAILSRSLPRVSDVLARFALEHAADAIVMGAYSHSRLREAIFGGATRDMLEAAHLPLIMAH